MGYEVVELNVAHALVMGPPKCVLVATVILILWTIKKCKQKGNGVAAGICEVIFTSLLSRTCSTPLVGASPPGVHQVHLCPGVCR